MNRHYYLEGMEGLRSRRYPLAQLPAVVGRHADCDLQLNMDSISRQHARFDERDGRLYLTDLGSTNGTFVNRQPIGEPTEIEPGSILHLGDQEFRLMREDPALTDTDAQATRAGITSLPQRFPLHTREFFQLLEKRQVLGYGQRIVHSDGSTFGRELLGRGNHPELPPSPGALFKLAESLDEAVTLSRLFRERCFEQAAEAGLREPLFFNTHPHESEDFDRLLAHLTELRESYPQLSLVFEVHEKAISDLAAMAEVKRALRQLDIGLAYDDFGAGQARLLEVVEVPPDFLKFDIALVRDLESAHSGRYELLATLNQLISNQGIRTLAEGVETEQTAGLCRQIGIDYIQGFLYARPEPIVSP